MDGFWLPCVCFADDILLISASKTDLQMMIAEVSAAFAATGLEVSARKCKWTSYPAVPGSTLEVGVDILNWTHQIIFVGYNLCLLASEQWSTESHKVKKRLTSGNRSCKLSTLPYDSACLS